MPVILFFLLLQKVRFHKLRQPIDRDIARAINSEHLFLGAIVILVPQYAGEVSKDSVGVGHDLAVELDDRDIAGRIHSTSLHEGGFDVLRILVESVEDIMVGNSSINEKEANDMATAF